MQSRRSEGGVHMRETAYGEAENAEERKVLSLRVWVHVHIVCVRVSM